MKKVFFLPNSIFDYQLTPIELSVYCYLHRCRNMKNGGTCFPSRKNIAEQCKISSSSVTRAIRLLSDKQLILVEPQFRGRRQTSNLYTLPEFSTGVSEENAVVVTEPPSSVSHRTPPIVTQSREINKQYELNYTNNNTPSFNKELAEILECAELDLVTDQYMRETIESLVKQMFVSEFITVDSAVISNEQIIKQLHRLTGDAVRYALEKFRENGGNITRGSKYLMACLYNSVNDFDIQTDLEIPRL